MTMNKSIIQQQFSARFGEKPTCIKSPGRINLIGEHTDYNEGFVMPASIDKQILFAVAPSGKNGCTIVSLDYDKSAEFEITNCAVGEGEKWEQYFRAALEELKSRGIGIPQGFNLVFGGDIPIGAGLSSSAALCCGFLFALDAIFALKLSRKELALIAQATEHRIGLNCGIMDQYAVLFGAPESFICLDCRSLEFETYSTDFGDYEMLLINSKLEHELTDSAYNDRRRSCEAVVKAIAGGNAGIKSLRDISLEELLQHESQLNPEDFRRARFVLNENDRVMQTTKALRANDLPAVGALLYGSHEGLSKDYEVSTPELDLLVALTRNEEAVLGGRMMGGGFGGCTLNIVHKAQSAEVAERILKAYKKETGIDGEAYFVHVSSGVNLLG